MARKTLADRLQSGFEALPTTPGARTPPPVPPRRMSAARKRVQLVIGLALMGVCVLAFLGGVAYLIGSGVWWHTASVETCTVTDFSRDWHEGKYGPGVVWTIDTEDCGTLQITSGPNLGMTVPVVDQMGNTMWTGDRYRFDLRGWAGWPGEPKAIVAAKDLTNR
jgi:hypothetical protein